jgi:hypothetical protein
MHEKQFAEEPASATLHEIAVYWRRCRTGQMAGIYVPVLALTASAALIASLMVLLQA